MTTGGPTRRSSRRPATLAARTAPSAPCRIRSAATVGWTEAAALPPAAVLTTTRSAQGSHSATSSARASSPVTSPTGIPHAPRIIAFRPYSPVGRPSRRVSTGGERVGVGDRPAPVARPGVIADEQRDVEAGVRTGTLHHRPRLLTLEHARRRMESGRQQVVHATVAVVDQDVVGAARQGTLDRGVRLADHQVHRGRIAGVTRAGRAGVVHPGDALHVDAHVDLHRTSSGPVRAWWPIQTCPSANRSAFQIGARAFVSSIA